jgi:3-oxoadipate enol-lactonase
MPYLDRGDARIYWEARGSGDPVLLIMGLGYPSDMWYRTIPALTAHHRTITFDNRGVGRTGVPPGPYPIELLAEDAAAVAAEAAGRPVHVIGISLGGIVAQEFALRHPGQVRSLALIATHPGGPDAVPPEPAALELLAKRGDMDLRQAAEISVPFIYAPDTPRELIDEDIATRLRRPTEPGGYANQLQGAVAYSGAYDRLNAIEVPTLVVHGSADRLVPPANAPLIAAAIPGARLEILDGASHILPTDRTGQLNRLLTGFLASVSP